MSVKFILTHPKAVVPTRANEYAIGHDLTIIAECKNPPKHACKNLCYYDTYLQVEPPAGYYLEVVPRSSISKTGYMLANSIGIIDPDYRGNILVALIKVDPTAPDLVIPDGGMKIAQLVLRRIELAPFVHVERLSDTVRGDGGFGSTDNK